MDILHLTYFIEVARHGSFTKAAQALHVSQPSISKMIKNLEDELGVPLFYRTSKQVRLTDAGMAIFSRAQQTIDSLRSLTADLADIIQVRKGHIKIGIPPMVETFFPKAIGAFKKQYPEIELELYEAGSKKVESAVADGTLDTGVVMLPIKRQEELNLLSFIKDPVMVIVHSDNPLAEKNAVSIKELQAEPLILFREDFALHDHILDKFAESGFKPKIVCESSQWDFMVNIVEAKLGIAFLPRIVCSKLGSHSIKSLELQETISPWHLAIAWKKNTYLSFAAKQWLLYVSKLFGVPLELPYDSAKKSGGQQ
ncbi:MAG: LysR family transcriptional regulator [Veillonellales bacterium]